MSLLALDSIHNVVVVKRVHHFAFAFFAGALPTAGIFK